MSLFWVALQPCAAFAQRLGGAAAPVEPSLTRIILAFVVCLAAGAGLILFLKRRMRPGASLQRSPEAKRFWGLLDPAAPRRLRVLESVAITPHAAVILVQCDGDELLIGANAQTFVLLDKHPASIPEQGQ